MRFARIALMLSAAVALMVVGGQAQPGGDAAVQALAKEVAGRGWIAFAAHPLEITQGKEIADHGKRGQTDLYFMRPDGSGLRNFTNTPGFSEYGARFSPDSKKMLYRRIPADQRVAHDLWGAAGQLLIANADGSSPRIQGKAGEYPWASWGPKGERIACLYKREGVIRFFSLRDKKQLGEMPRQGIFQQMFWSPDGRRLCGTANVQGRDWNVVSVELATQKLTVLTTDFNCTPDWFRTDANRVICSWRHPRLGAQSRGQAYGSTNLMQATADGKGRTLVYGDYDTHSYFSCLSPDDQYVVFATHPSDGGVSGDLHILRLKDTPIVTPGFDALKALYPNAKTGPVLDLKLKSGGLIRGFEPHWTYADVAAG